MQVGGKGTISPKAGMAYFYREAQKVVESKANMNSVQGQQNIDEDDYKKGGTGMTLFMENIYSEVRTNIKLVI